MTPAFTAPTGAPITTDAARAMLVRACRHLSSAGLSPGSSGNVSVRVGDLLLMTPTGSALSRVREQDLALVELRRPVGAGRNSPGADPVSPRAAPARAGDGPHASAPSPVPSKEAPLHRAAYELRPGTGAVVHLHSPYATAIACLGADEHGHAQLPALTPYRAMRLGDVPLVPYAPPGSAALAEGVAAVIARHPAVLLANHGSVVAAPTLEAAIDLAEELESAAQLTLLLRGATTTTTNVRSHPPGK